MNGLASRLPAPKGAGAVVVAVGLVLAGVHAMHAAGELTDNRSAVFYGAVLPLLVSLLVVAGGLRIASRDWPAVSPWWLVGWIASGMVVSALLTVLLLRYQDVEGVDLEHWQFVLAAFVSYGAAIGFFVGRYDVRAREARAALAHKAQRLDEFVSIVSHDLRNPLNVAKGYVDLTRETGDAGHLSPVSDAHNRMDVIIRDMLSLARNGERAVTPTAVSLPGTAERAWEMIDADETTLDVTADERIYVDRSRLETIFENLFRNAVEHNQRPLTVSVGTLENGFYVEDTGDGVSPEFRERVFEAGYTRDGGTGLGLAIVRAAADAHNWSYALTSGRAGGARFEFTDVAFVSGPGADRSNDDAS